MGALSDRSILQGMRDNEIIIHPFNPADLGSASYDLRLGRYYYETLRPPDNELPRIYNIYSRHSTEIVWGKAKAARLARDWMQLMPSADWDNIDESDEIIMLRPRANLLCHTYEFIGARINATTMMKARSSIGRSLVNVCQCAGMGDVGYFNRWTMEVHNRDDYHIPLVVHRRVAQLVFLPTGPSDKFYLSKYQGTGDLASLERDWSPEMMLPRLDQDRDIDGSFVSVEY